MTSNPMFPLTLKPSKKKNATLVVGKEKYAQLDTAFTVESVHNSNEENSVHNTKKGENGAEMKATTFLVMAFHIWTFELWRSKFATHKKYGKMFSID
jgi:hypothetical protein